jgi:hypothetical protein
VPETHCASTEGFDQLDPKMRIINVLFLRTISEIKLKRTDTTLDLSQKALMDRKVSNHDTKCVGAVRDLQRELKKRENMWVEGEEYILGSSALADAKNV